MYEGSFRGAMTQGLDNFPDKWGWMKLLLSNDDGIYAEGLGALHRQLSDTCSTVVVAPDQECSAISHAITLEMPIRCDMTDYQSIRTLKLWDIGIR